MKKKIIALLMCVVLTASAFSTFMVPSSAVTRTVVDGKKTWTIRTSSSSAYIVRLEYDGTLISLTVPKTISNYTVKGFDSGALRGFTDLQKISLSNLGDYITIGDYAFADCPSLTSITGWPAMNNIGANILYNTGIYNDESKWTDGMLYIKNRCLVSVKPELSGTVTLNSYANAQVIAKGAFADCNKIEKIIIPEGVRIIGNNAFSGCSKLKEIDLPSTLQSIPSNCFTGCNSLKEVIARCPSQYLVGIKDYLTQYIGVMLDGFSGFTALRRVEIPQDAVVFAEAFKDCTALTEIICNGNLTACGENAFLNTAYYNNPKNWDTIGNVLYIGNCLVKADESISHCYRVKDGTVSIAYNAFAHCTKLKELAIPACVTNIPCLGDVGMCTYEGEHDLCALKIIAPKNSAAMAYAQNNSMLFACRCLDEHAPRGLVLGGSNKNVEFWYNGCDNCATNLERVIRAKDGYTLSYDIDGNNELSNDDYNLLKDYIETGEGLTDSQLALADMNHDGVIDAFDLFTFNNYQYNYDFKD